jgi:hypothetical protein
MFGVKGNIALASILFCVQHFVFIRLSGREIPRAQELHLQDDLIVVRKKSHVCQTTFVMHCIVFLSNKPAGQHFNFPTRLVCSKSMLASTWNNSLGVF